VVAKADQGLNHARLQGQKRVTKSLVRVLVKCPRNSLNGREESKVQDVHVWRVRRLGRKRQRPTTKGILREDLVQVGVIRGNMRASIIML
ncbi:hypothetical protein As57867_004872, partial [Aphanomyces stellatus]